MPTITIARPAADEYLEYYGRYIALVPGDDALPVLARAQAETHRLLAGLDEARALHRYAPGKWSVKEVLGHLADGERVFGYRALRFARADQTPLPGFDENTYVPAGKFGRRTLADMAAEFAAVRAATLALARSLDDEALLRRGTASDCPFSVRALVAIIAGHELHHVALLRERYGLTG